MKQYFTFNGKKTKLQAGDVLYWDKNEQTLTLWRDKQLILFFDVNHKHTTNRIPLMANIDFSSIHSIAEIIAIQAGLNSTTCNANEFAKATGMAQTNPMAAIFI